MKNLISGNSGLLVSCDFVSEDKLREVVSKTCEIEGVVGYKLGFLLGYSNGLRTGPRIIREYTTKHIMYDHQKAGTDTTFMGVDFAKLMKDSGMDSVILFPFTGPFVEDKWIDECRKNDLGVLVGGDMTVEGFRESEGGFMCDIGIKRIYEIGVKNGLEDFVIPRDDTNFALEIKNEIIRNGCVNPQFYSPGYGRQGASVWAMRKVIGDFFPIVGRDIFESFDIVKSTEYFLNELYKTN